MIILKILLHLLLHNLEYINGIIQTSKITQIIKNV